MLKEKAKRFMEYLFLRIKNGYNFCFNPNRGLMFFIKSWWHILIITIAAVIFLYYPLGGYLISDIDNNKDYEINTSHPEQSSTIEMMSFLINREVNEKLWTPNLPFFFPSYFLDNMPNFQQGIITSVGTMSSAFSKKLDRPIHNQKKLSPLDEAAELLQYPSTVWMFSPENKLIPAPSSTKQYRKARRRLIRQNMAFAAGAEIFYRNPQDLAYFLKCVNSSLQKSNQAIEAQIRENSPSWYDGKADDVFYYNQGKTYGYYLLLEALGNDYKDIIVNCGEYENWTRLLKSLEDASQISPFIVRNSELNSSFGANHLAYLSREIQKSQNLILKISAKLTVN